MLCMVSVLPFLAGYLFDVCFFVHVGECSSIEMFYILTFN